MTLVGSLVGTPPAHALRPANAGLESSPTREELAAALDPAPAAGLEAGPPQLFSSLADQGSAAPSKARESEGVGPSGRRAAARPEGGQGAAEGRPSASGLEAAVRLVPVTPSGNFAITAEASRGLKANDAAFFLYLAYIGLLNDRQGVPPTEAQLRAEIDRRNSPRELFDPAQFDPASNRLRSAMARPGSVPFLLLPEELTEAAGDFLAAYLTWERQGARDFDAGAVPVPADWDLERAREVVSGNVLPLRGVVSAAPRLRTILDRILLPDDDTVSDGEADSLTAAGDIPTGRTDGREGRLKYASKGPPVTQEVMQEVERIWRSEFARISHKDRKVWIEQPGRPVLRPTVLWDPNGDEVGFPNHGDIGKRMKPTRTRYQVQHILRVIREEAGDPEQDFYMPTMAHLDQRIHQRERLALWLAAYNERHPDDSIPYAAGELEARYGDAVRLLLDRLGGGMGHVVLTGPGGIPQVVSFRQHLDDYLASISLSQAELKDRIDALNKLFAFVSPPAGGIPPIKINWPEEAPGADPAAGLEAARIDPDRLFNREPAFLEAVRYFNETVLPAPAMTWAHAMELFWRFRAEPEDPELLARRVAALEDDPVAQEVMRLVNDRSFAERTDRVAADQIAVIYSLMGTSGEDELFIGLEGFSDRAPGTAPAHDVRHPASGHKRLTWFLANYFLIRNGYAPVYFQDDRDAWDRTFEWFPIPPADLRRPTPAASDLGVPAAEILQVIGERDWIQMRNFSGRLLSREGVLDRPVRIAAVLSDADWTLFSTQTDPKNEIPGPVADAAAWILNRGGRFRLVTLAEPPYVEARAERQIVARVRSPEALARFGGYARSGGNRIVYRDGQRIVEPGERVFSPHEWPLLGRIFGEELLSEIARVMPRVDLAAPRTELAQATDFQAITAAVVQAQEAAGIVRQGDYPIQNDAKNSTVFFVTFQEGSGIDAERLLDQVRTRVGAALPERTLHFARGPHYVSVGLYQKPDAVALELSDSWYDAPDQDGVILLIGDGADDLAGMRRALLGPEFDRRLALGVMIRPEVADLRPEDPVVVPKDRTLVPATQQVLGDLVKAASSGRTYGDWPFIGGKYSIRQLAQALDLPAEVLLETASSRSYSDFEQLRDRRLEVLNAAGLETAMVAGPPGISWLLPMFLSSVPVASADREVRPLRFIVDTGAGEFRVLRLLQLAVTLRLAGAPVEAAGVATEAELAAAQAGLEDAAARRLLADLVYTYRAGNPADHALALALAQAAVPVHPENIISGITRSTITWFLEALDTLGLRGLTSGLEQAVESYLTAA
ncbi:MAG: hypothetical protein COV76_02015 [Candidatus Omnitrophica bacterium CG11_big_fil_rev_8_21_14_0_20_64_10]|nr:MAG: hypothetical protein COV76_02015 [Candidatus Omnitrophica bacterium CG11_big_fil_rev_8_21_14_0_20_64_10]